jgi:pimeloyl-ACP methyl ester carboxylesterase
VASPFRDGTGTLSTTSHTLTEVPTASPRDRSARTTVKQEKVFVMSTVLADGAETRFVAGPFGERFAYRRFGRAGGTPLVLLMRLRGTIDHWDPAFLDALAEQREVIIFDNRGANLSTGTPPDSVDGLADGAIAFIRALGLSAVDLLGWSLGGMVAQGVALRAPELVRRLVVAGSSPGGVPQLAPMPEKVVETIRKPVNDDEDFLYLFFPENEKGRAAGLASLRRLDRRLAESTAVIGPEATRGQLIALSTMKGYWDRLDELRQPVLVANGTDDVMIDAYASYAMARRAPAAKLVLYSGAGHAFLFQEIADFVMEVDNFLGAPAGGT